MVIVESPDATAASEAESVHRPIARKKRVPPPSRRSRMLSVSGDRCDHDSLSEFLDNEVWQLDTATNCREAIKRLQTYRARVVLCEHTLADGTWKELYDWLKGAGKEVPMIVTSRLADEHMWAEVLNLGGFDVLQKPFRENEVIHTVTSALLYGIRRAPGVRAAGG